MTLKSSFPPLSEQQVRILAAIAENPNCQKTEACAASIHHEEGFTAENCPTDVEQSGTQSREAQG